MVQWFNGSMVQWFNGSMVQWFNGSMVQWFNGSMVPVCFNHGAITNHKVGSMSFKNQNLKVSRF
jgi:hypothetical protein